MPRFYFDIVDAGRPTIDAFGVDLADDDEARDQAVALLAQLARDELPDGDQHEFAVEVRDERGVAVYAATLSLDGRWHPGRR